MDEEIANVPLFADIASASAEVLSRCHIRNYAQGDVVLCEGDEAIEALVLLAGEVQISMGGTLLATRRRHDLVGEQALIEQQRRTATVTALGAVRALALSAEAFELLSTDAAFSRNILRTVSSKLSEATSERAWRYAREQLLFHEFSAHLSPEVTDELLNSGRSYGEPRLMTGIILISDIRSYTATSSGRSAMEVAAELSPYLEWVVSVIHDHQGMIDKFIGDAVLAVWGFPPGPHEPQVQAAFDCATAMVLGAASRSLGGETLRIGVGMNFGEVFVGNIGGGAKRQFTVIGSVVNLASRYESESKLLAPIVMGPDFVARLGPDVATRLTRHPDYEIRGTTRHDIYSFDPLQ